MTNLGEKLTDEAEIRHVTTNLGEKLTEAEIRHVTTNLGEKLTDEKADGKRHRDGKTRGIVRGQSPGGLLRIVCCGVVELKGLDGLPLSGQVVTLE